MTPIDIPEFVPEPISIEIITEEELPEKEQALIEVSSSLYETIENGERIGVALEAINILIEKKEAGEQLSLESFDLIGSMVTSGTLQPGSDVIDSTLSLESLMSQRNGIISNLFYSISNSFEKLIEMNHYCLSIMDFQTRRLLKTRELLKESLNKNKVIKFRVNKWTKFGDRQTSISTASEYLEEYRKMTSIIADVSVLLEQLITADMFGWLKWLASGLTGQSDKFIENHMTLAETEYGKVVRNYYLDKSKILGNHKCFYSAPLLGLFQVEIWMPKTRKIDLGYFSNTFPTLHVERAAKLSSKSEGTLEIEFLRKDVNVLLELTETLLGSANRVSSLSSRVIYLSTLLGSIIKANVLFFSPKGTKVINKWTGTGLNYASGLTKSGRIMLRIAASVYSGTAAVYNLGFGNAKQALTIAEKFIK